MEDQRQPRFPLEVAELVIDNAADADDSTFSSLKQLSLACHDFLSLARKHIFGTIIVGKFNDSFQPTSPTVNRLHNLLLQSPVIAGYIHTFVYYADLQDIPSKPWISSLFNQLTKLRSLTIDTNTGLFSFDWSTKDHHAACEAFASLIQLPTLTHLRLCAVLAFSISDLMTCTGLKALDLSHVVYELPENSSSSQTGTQPSHSIQLDHLSLKANNFGDIPERLWMPWCAGGRSHLDLSALKSLDLGFDNWPDQGLNNTALLGLFRSRQLTEVRVRFPLVPYFRGISRLLRGSQESLKKISLETEIGLYLGSPRRREDSFREICHELEEIRQWGVVEEISVVVGIHAQLQNPGDEWGSLDRALTRSEWTRLKRVTFIVVAVDPYLEDRTAAQAALRDLPERRLRGLMMSPTVEFEFIVTNHVRADGELLLLNA